MRRATAACLFLALAAGAPAAHAATWSGTFRLPSGREGVAMSLDLTGSRAIVALAPGHAGPTSVRATVRGTRVGFALPGRPGRLRFDGRRRGRSLSGSVVQGTLRGSFRLTRGPASPLRRLGLYRGPSGAVTVVKPQGSFPQWLVELPSGDVHGLDSQLSVGTLLGSTTGAGSLRVDGAGFIWTRAGSATRFDRVSLRQEEIRFGALAGTLTLPPGQGRFPAVAMVHGSGPQTRAELQTFVTFCALHGIAVLAYDKRGVGQSGGAYPGERASEGTIDVLARDAEAAARFLAAQPEVDSQRVGLLGDSQAGWIVALAASHERAVRWAVLLAGPTIDVGRTDTWGALAGQGQSPPSAPFDQLETQIRGTAPSGFDPRPFLASLSIPGLWLFGDSDRNIPTQLSVEALQQLAPRHDFSWVVLRGTSHTLLDLPSGLNDDIPRSRGFAAGLYTTIEQWLRMHGLSS